MKSVSLLTTIALCSLLGPALASLPVAAQVVPAATTPAAVSPIAIGDQAAFEAAVAPDGPLAALSAATPEGQMATATLSLATGRYFLPEGINVPRVHVTITSADPVDPVGSAHREQVRDSAQGATLIHKEKEYVATAIMSPVTIANVHLELQQSGRAMFAPSSALTIRNVNAYGKAGQFSPPKLVELTNANETPTVNIRDSRLDDVLAIRVYKTLGTTHIEGNVFTNQRGGVKTIELDLGIRHKPVPDTPGSHVIRNNLFNQKSYNTAIVAGRPGMLIEHNEFFTLENGKNASVAISPGYRRVFNDIRPLLTNIEVAKNCFTGAQQPVKAVGMELWQWDSLGKQQLHIHDNDFSAIETGMKVLSSWKTDEPIRFDRNYLGRAINELKPETVMNPLDAASTDAGLIKPTTPPPPVTPPPVNPPPVNPPPVSPPPVNPPNPPVNPPAPQPQPDPQPQPSARPHPSVSPSPNGTADPDGRVSRMSVRHAGETRFETAAKLAATVDTTTNKTVIVTRHDVAADSVSAVPLAAALGAPVLLTPPDQLHPATKAAITKALPEGGTVIIMGGEMAVSAAVQQQIAALGVRTERIAGVNRAATAVVTAERLEPLGKAKEVLLADGTDWQPTLIAGPAAAAVQGVTLLSNGATIAPETEAYLNHHTGVKVTAIGAKATQSSPKVGLTLGVTDPSQLSVDVAQAFFTNPPAAGLATTADFADALAGGAHLASVGGPLLLTHANAPATLKAYMANTKGVGTLHVYGGPARINEQVVRELTQGHPATQS